LGVLTGGGGDVLVGGGGGGCVGWLVGLGFPPLGFLVGVVVGKKTVPMGRGVLVAVAGGV